MKSIMAVAAITLAIGGSAFAQDSYNEELYEKGTLSLSNMEQRIARILEANDVSRECMGQLNLSDATQIYGIINGDEGSSQKRSAVKVILDRMCG